MSPAVRTKKAWIEVLPNWHLKHDLDTKARLIWLEITIRTKKNENVVSFHIVVGVKTVHKATLQSRPSSFSLPATLHTGRQGKITPELFCEGGPEDCTMTSPRRDLYMIYRRKLASTQVFIELRYGLYWTWLRHSYLTRHNYLLISIMCSIISKIQ